MDENSAAKTRVFLADDHPATLGGLRAILQEPDIEVVGTAATGRDAVAKVLSHEPDVIILDIRLPDISGHEAMKRIKAGAPGVAVILFTAFEEPSYLLDAVLGGAAGFLLKTATPEEVLDTVRKVAAGDTTLTPEVWKPLLLDLQKAKGSSTAESPVPLNDRDRLILRSMARGASNLQLEKILDVGSDGVRFHLKKLFKKMGTSDRAQAVALALKWGILRFDEI